ncbi:hypothetical protein L0F63_006693 [Massospora cicadina]|nr:hypothetical protein L0F63_006693 [Massospora cicadina]
MVHGIKLHAVAFFKRTPVYFPDERFLAPRCKATAPKPTSPLSRPPITYRNLPGYNKRKRTAQVDDCISLSNAHVDDYISAIKRMRDCRSLEFH